MKPDPFARNIADGLRSHVGALSEQQLALAAHPEYREEACRLNRGLCELEVALKLLEQKARAAA